MTAVGGSASRGQADAFSDIDFAVYWDEVDAEWLELAPLGGAGTERFTFRNVVQADPGVWLEQYFIGKLKVDVAHLPLRWVAREFADLTARFDITPDRQEIPEGMLSAAPIFGQQLYGEWLQRLRPYPPELARRMVTEHLVFTPPWVFVNQGIARDDLLIYYDLLVPALKSVASVLAGINRVYVCTAKLKRIEAWVDGLVIRPERASNRIRALLERDNFTENYTALVEDTWAMVRREMPEIDLSAARRTFGIVIDACETPPPFEA